MLKEVGLKRILKYLIFDIWNLIFMSLPYSPLRIWWLRCGGAKIGKNCFVERIYLMNLDRTGLKGLSLGSRCYLGPLVLLDLAGLITLSDQVTVSAKATVLSHYSVGFAGHPLLKFYPKKITHTKIESGSAIGVNATILPGVTVGRESLVAAGAVVRTDVPSHVMVAGVPAEVKKRLK